MKITELYIDAAVLDFPVTRHIIRRLDLNSHVVDAPDDMFREIAASDSPVDQGKKILFLTQNRGRFIRQCPGTEYYTCCNYMILHVGTFCTMDCAYCILQSYFHPPVLQFFVNHDDMTAALDQWFSENPEIRIGTGEFTDSLIWETIYPLSEMLISRFARQNRSVLELKTKTVNIDHLLNFAHNRKTIMAWSLNTFRIVKSEERGTASIPARLAAAAKCQAKGYPLAFHFDPLVIYPGCEADYQQVIEQLFKTIAADNIVWISLGSFRFMPDLKPIVEKRFEQSKIVYGEFVKGIDGKMRYFKPLRIRFYQTIVSCIRALAPDVTLYFCMEDDEVWKKSLGFVPQDRGGLPGMLDASAVRHCHLER